MTLRDVEAGADACARAGCWRTPILPRRGCGWLTAVAAGLGSTGHGSGRAGLDRDRLWQLLAGGVSRQFGAACKCQDLAEDADILLAEQRALLDAGLRQGVCQAGDVVVLLMLRATAERAGEVGVQGALMGDQLTAETLHEVIVAILLVAGERRHHQFALQAGDIEGGHVCGLRAWLGRGDSGGQQSAGEQSCELDVYGDSPRIARSVPSGRWGSKSFLCGCGVGRVGPLPPTPSRKGETNYHTRACQ